MGFLIQKILHIQFLIFKFLSIYFVNNQVRVLSQKKHIKDFKICFFGNIANNHYSTIKELRKHNFKVSLVLSN